MLTKFYSLIRSDMDGLDHAVLAVGYGTIAGQVI